ncbi:MAG: hypothetical protein AAB562_04490 [Patescibacteria group bacterium]
MDEGRISKILEEMDKKLDRVITAVVSRGEKLDTPASRDDLGQFRGKVMDALDKRMVVLQRLDQERVFTVEWIRRIGKDVERIKVHLKLA